MSGEPAGQGYPDFSEFCVECGMRLDEDEHELCTECEGIAAGSLDACETCGTAIAKGERHCLMHTPETQS